MLSSLFQAYICGFVYVRAKFLHPFMFTNLGQEEHINKTARAWVPVCKLEYHSCCSSQVCTWYSNVCAFQASFFALSYMAWPMMLGDQGILLQSGFRNELQKAAVEIFSMLSRPADDSIIDDATDLLVIAYIKEGSSMQCLATTAAK